MAERTTEPLPLRDWLTLAGQLTREHPQFQQIECWPEDGFTPEPFDPPVSFAVPAVRAGDAVLFVGQVPLLTTLSEPDGMRPVAVLDARSPTDCVIRKRAEYDIRLRVDGLGDRADGLPSVSACWERLNHLRGGAFTGSVSPDLDLGPGRCPIHVEGHAVEPAWIDVSAGRRFTVTVTREPSSGQASEALALLETMDEDVARHGAALEALADELEALGEAAGDDLSPAGRVWLSSRAAQLRRGILDPTMLEVESEALDILDAAE